MGEIGRRKLFGDVLDSGQPSVDYKKQPLLKINKFAKFVFYQRGLAMIFVKTCNFSLLIIIFLQIVFLGYPLNEKGEKNFSLERINV